MTDKKQNEELNETDLENVQGGVYLPEFKKVRGTSVDSKTSKEFLSSGHSTGIKKTGVIVTGGGGSGI